MGWRPSSWWGRSHDRESPLETTPDTAVAAAPLTRPEPGAWRDLPTLVPQTATPVQRIAVGDDFRAALTTHADPRFLQPLAHQVDPSVGGLVDGLVLPGRPVAHDDGPELRVPVQRSAKPAPQVQRRVAWSGADDLTTVRWELPDLVAGPSTDSATPVADTRTVPPERVVVAEPPRAPRPDVPSTLQRTLMSSPSTIPTTGAAVAEAVGRSTAEPGPEPRTAPLVHDHDHGPSAPSASPTPTPDSPDTELPVVARSAGGPPAAPPIHDHPARPGAGELQARPLLRPEPPVADEAQTALGWTEVVLPSVRPAAATAQPFDTPDVPVAQRTITDHPALAVQPVAATPPPTTRPPMTQPAVTAQRAVTAPSPASTSHSVAPDRAQFLAAPSSQRPAEPAVASLVPAPEGPSPVQRSVQIGSPMSSSGAPAAVLGRRSVSQGPEQVTPTTIGASPSPLTGHTTALPVVPTGSEIAAGAQSPAVQRHQAQAVAPAVGRAPLPVGLPVVQPSPGPATPSSSPLAPAGPAVTGVARSFASMFGGPGEPTVGASSALPVTPPPAGPGPIMIGSSSPSPAPSLTVAGLQRQSFDDVAGSTGSETSTPPTTDTSTTDTSTTGTSSTETSTADNATTGTGTAAPSPTPAPAAAAPADLDEMARRLYDPLMARLRAELWLDRERAGVFGDG